MNENDQYDNLRGDESLFTEAQSCDLSRAAYNERFSAIGLDEVAETFWASVDKVVFNRPYEIVRTVLLANGFVINMENVLAALESMVLGVRGRVSSRRRDDEPPVVKGFTYGLHFYLPSKRRIGELLQLFYDEIGSYERELGRLQDPSRKKKEEDEKSAGELRREVRDLRKANATLEARVHELATRLASLRQSHDAVHRQAVEGRAMPEDIREAKVRDVALETRLIHLSVGRRSMTFPLARASLVPRPGDRCLIHVRDAQVRDVLFFESEPRPFALQTATVLHVEGDQMKVRDQSRRTRIIRAVHIDEADVMSTLRRGQVIILYTFDDQLVRFVPVEPIHGDVFVNRIQQAITLHQIGKALDRSGAAEEQDRGEVA